MEDILEVQVTASRSNGDFSSILRFTDQTPCTPTLWTFKLFCFLYVLGQPSLDKQYLSTRRGSTCTQSGINQATIKFLTYQELVSQPEDGLLIAMFAFV